MYVEDFKCEKYDKKRKIIVYGNDEFSIITAYCLNEFSIPFLSCAESGENKFLDIHVMNIGALAELYAKEKPIILLAMNGFNFKRIMKQLEAEEIDEVFTIWSLLDAVDFCKSDYDENIKWFHRFRHVTYVEQEKVINPSGFYCRSIDAMVTEKCSLRCKDCSNLMQYYAEPKDLDLDKLMESIDVMVSKMDRIAQLRILGGEPIVNKNFVRVVDAYLNEPKILQIAIYTNTTIFPSEEILKHICHKKISIHMSDYGPLSKKFDAWLDWCKKNNIEYYIAKMERWHDCGKLEKHDYSDSMLKAVYATCDCRNLPTIINDRLYNCPYAANAANLGAMDKDEAERDGLLLTKEDLSAEEIHTFLYERSYLEGCRYCGGRSWKALIKPYIQTKTPLEYEKRVDKSVELTDEKKVSDVPEENALVSIVVPVYNVAGYIERSIRSIMNQSYKNLEIIIVDDGSTDGSFEICEALLREDARIKHIKSTHQGTAITRNIGIEQATGKYMLFVDGDDYVEQSYVQEMIGEFGDCDVVFAGFEIDKEYDDNYQIAPYNKTHVIRNDLKEGIYQGKELEQVWSVIFQRPTNIFVANIWRFAFLTSKMKQVCKQLDTSIWLGEDTTLARLYLLCCNKINIAAPAGYHYCPRINDGDNKRYFYDKEGALDNVDRLYWCMRQAIKGHASEDILKWYLDRELILRARAVMWRYQGEPKVFYYPYHCRLEGKKIVLYGAGNVGKSYKNSIIEAKESQLVLWIDKVTREEEGVSDVSEILNVDYDFIIVAIFDEKVYEEIKANLLDMGIPEKKILWSRTREERF